MGVVITAPNKNPLRDFVDDFSLKQPISLSSKEKRFNYTQTRRLPSQPNPSGKRPTNSFLMITPWIKAVRLLPWWFLMKSSRETLAACTTMIPISNRMQRSTILRRNPSLWIMGGLTRRIFRPRQVTRFMGTPEKLSRTSRLLRRRLEVTRNHPMFLPRVYRPSQQ